MFGKAVKIRHCPATVSAPDLHSVYPRRNARQDSAIAFRLRGEHIHWVRAASDSLREGRRKKAQVRRPVRGVFNRFHVPRGTKELSMPVSVICPRHSSSNFHPSLHPRLCRTSASFCCNHLPRRIRPRRSHRRHRRQSHRRFRGRSSATGRSLRLPSPRRRQL